MPRLCSVEAAAISAMMSVTRLMAMTMSLMVWPAWATRVLPFSTLLTESEISVLISLAAAAERCARVRTSAATTAKPRPCSPARAASTAALRARILVWKAMPSMTPMMSAILRADSLMAVMVLTTFCTTLPPSVATSEAFTARELACRAFSALSFTVLVSSSMLDAVSSRLEACCSVRVESSALPLEISPAAVLMVSAASRICPSMRDRLCAVSLE
ncbi:hypothetical protein D3C84_241700 [compost metagenome]